MAQRSVITGRVVDIMTGAGIADLRVEALDTAGLFRDLLGYARTDADGRFRMEVQAIDLGPLVGARAVVAYLRVVHEVSGPAYHLLADTRQSGPKWPLDGTTTHVDLRVNTSRVLSRLPTLPPFVVSGTLHDGDGPMGGVTVELYDRDPDTGTMTRLENIGSTDARGHYRVTYDPPGYQPADLVVRALTSPAVTESSARCNAPPSLVVNLVETDEVWRGHSTYKRTKERLAAAGVTSLDSVAADRRERLACSLQLPLADVTALCTAHSIAAASSLDELPAQALAEVAFAALSRGMGTDRDTFFQHPKRAVREALNAAVAENRVSQRYARQSEADAAVGHWVTAAAEWSLEDRSDPNSPCGLGEVLTVAGVTADGDRKTFAEQLCANESTMADFWDNLSGTFDKARIQLTLQWWSLARGHLPLIQELEARRAAEMERTLIDLAKFSEAEWLGILDGITPGPAAPSGIPGEDETERKENYARVLYRTMATAFPTRVFGRRVIANGEPFAIKAFFETEHTNFEFGKNRLSQEPFRTTVDAMANPDDRKRIRDMERVFRFAPLYEHVHALLDKGYDSAHKAHSVGKSKFVADMQASLGSTAVAEQIYMKACWQVNASTAVFAQFSPAVNKLPLKITPNLFQLSSTLQNDIPDWQTLFGNAGGCSCRHCAGVLGPAAYLTDTLAWLDTFESENDKVGGTGKWSALDVLVGGDEPYVTPLPGRRPDLQLLELTCKSAHTPQPYIDIVNELLELAVAKDAGLSFALPEPIKSTYEPEELAAGPEILYEEPHIGAWRSLMERVHPFTLPVCLFDREAEAYLQYLGVTRADIVEALGGEGDELAKARLGVRDDAHEAPNDALVSGWKLLLSSFAGGVGYDLWGVPNAASLRPVPTFLKHAGLTFSELEELLATRYVNGREGDGASGLAEIVIDPADGCDMSEMEVRLVPPLGPELTGEHLLRLTRILRLRLHTGLSFTDLDLLMAAFWTEPDPPEPMSIDETMLQNITGALALAKELKLTVREVAALFADLDIHERWEKKSPYRQYFLNRLVDSPEPAAFTAVLVEPTATDDLRAHRTALVQALGITEKELSLLVDADTLAAELHLPSDELVLEGGLGPEAIVLPTVSQLWRHVRFARALGLKLADYLILKSYSAETPIGVGATPAAAKDFVDLVRDYKAQRLPVADLQWILRAIPPSSGALTPDAPEIEALRAEIASAVELIVSETETTEDAADPDPAVADPRSRAFALLDRLLGPSERDAVLTRLRGSDEPPIDESWREGLDPIAPYLPGDAAAQGGPYDLLVGRLEEMEEPAPDVQHPPLLKSADERFAYVARWLDRHVRASRAIAEKIAAVAELPVATVTHLISAVLGSQTEVETTLLDDFLPQKKTDADPAQQRAGLSLVLRHARLIAALRIGDPIPPGIDAEPDAPDHPGELYWVYPSTPVPDGLHALPADKQSAGDFDTPDRTRFAAIVRIARRVGLRDRMKAGPHALRELLEAAPPDFAAARSLLAEKSGWDEDAITALCAPFGIEVDPGDPEELLADETLLKLERAMALIDRLGIEYQHVLSFLDLETVPPAAEATGLQPTTGGTPNARDLVIFARRAAKAKLSAEEWQKVAKKIRDPFRELQRDRLVDALVPKVHATREELYGFHLIDVDMSACMMTSRIVQATNAVQVFVQRSFLGLDDDVKLPPQATKQWEWRKAYRVWEANRKVFLWPENWLEPELRDDMTPLFRELLTHLASGELTDASAERALEKYLTGLHEIARLEPMALWYDRESDTDHVIARTRSQPRKWFYRRRDPDTFWTPWEKMDIDIDAESALLVGANRRLYLFWPQLLTKNDPVPPVAVDPPAEHPGPMPMPELGKTDEHTAALIDWEAKYTAWNEAQKIAAEPPKSPTQHYEVRVAWSSYMEGTWTPKRLSDCPPIEVAGARGDGMTGYEPEHIVFQMEPQEAVLEAQTSERWVHLLCVAVPWFPFMKNIRAGRFYFDACDGGRWTSKQLSVGDSLAEYAPTAPEGSRLSAVGFAQAGTGQAIVVPRASGTQKTIKEVPLFDSHEGRFAIVSPSSYDSSVTHAFERFVYADHKAVFHGRVHRPTVSLAAVADMTPGELVDLFPAAIDAEGSITTAIAGWAVSANLPAPTKSTDKYVLEIFEHPYVCEFANRLAADGVSGLLGWKDQPELSAQYLELQEEEEIEDVYEPTENIVGDFPRHEVSFDFGSTYGMYNWELFFHAPFTIAQRLSQEGRYAEAQKWYHFIFNPTSGLAEAGPRRFWCVKPFHEIHDLATIDQSLEALAADSSFAKSLQALVAEDEATQKTAEEMKGQIKAMAAHPFSPHVLARHRPLAYMKNVFMRYVQNLMDWADSLFRRDTMESIHEALTLYLLAADLLGPKPEILDHKADPPGKTFRQLIEEEGLDAFGNAAVEVETIVPKSPPPGFKCTDDGPPVPDFRLYFCVPPNDQLYGLWDTVADRLFKIRNCMNIEGVVRALPLFAPPIDPALLVRAAAAGVRLDQVLDALAAPSPLYRFVRLHAKATEFAGAVQSLGQAMLAALEKKDGEELALLRQRHELAVLDAEREIRKQAIQEARETLAGLNRSKEIAETRLQYYTGLIEKGLIHQEKDAESKTRKAKEFRFAAASVDSHGAMAGLVPDVITGALPGIQLGGRAVQLAASAVARGISSEADSLNTDASLAQTAAGYARRLQEWKLQKSVGEKEVAQLEKQIIAQEIRLAMAERELENLDLRRDQSREIETFFRRKFTSHDLYTWMSAQLASEHYRAYQTAYDMAKKAERAYQLERGDEKAFIRFGAWDSLKKGLLAGERLLQDLRALDAAYLSRSDREREIVKHISLAELAGEQLTKLRDEGAADLELHTYHFDADYPGHYFRRIKNVAISVATVRPAADGVQCELTLLKSACRKTSQVGDAPYPGEPYTDDLHRFSTAAVKALATSTAENDPGLFEVSLKDEMLLPFEGAGAVSQWRIEIDPRTNRFPMHRISDVVLHLRYTAKDGGAGLKGEAITYAERTDPGEDPEDLLPVGLKQRTRVFSARRDFDEAWSVFTTGTLLEDPPSTWVNRLELRFVQSHFRSFFGDPKVKIVGVQVSATFNEKYNPPPRDPEEPPPDSLEYTLTPPAGGAVPGTIGFRKGEPSDSPALSSVVDVQRDDETITPWVFQVDPAATPSEIWDDENPDLLKPDVLEDIWFTVTYERQ